MTIVTPKQFNAFVRAYNLNQFPGERLGQAFCNEFFIDEHSRLSDHDLYYTTDNYDCYMMIMDKYVDWDWTA
jgi:hypothetical protein